MAWLVELLTGFFLWLAAVLTVPLALCAAIYVYIEGVPKELQIFTRVFGDILRVFVRAICNLIAEITAIEGMRILLETRPYVFALGLTYLLVLGQAQLAFLVGTLAALVEATLVGGPSPNWVWVVLFYGAGVLGLVLRAADASSPLLTCATIFLPIALGYSTVTLVDMIGRDGASFFAHASQSAPRPGAAASRVGGDSAGGAADLAGLVEGLVEGARAGLVEGEATQGLRPLFLLAVALFTATFKGSLSGCFAVCTFAALVEITNEQ